MNHAQTTAKMLLLAILMAAGIHTAQAQPESVEKNPVRQVSAPAPDQNPAPADSASLNSYCGAYEMQNGMTAYISLENNILHAEAEGVGKFPLQALSPSEFFLADLNAKFIFQKGDHGEISSVLVQINGEDLTGGKINSSTPLPVYE